MEGSYYNSQTGMPNRDFRPRRPHTKSKNGCNQCKNRRIKCDELKPRCTRCSKGDLLCKYPDTTAGGQPGPSGRPRNIQLPPGADPSPSSSPVTPVFPGHGAPSPGPYPGSYYLVHPFDHIALSTCNHPSRAPCPVVPPPPGLPAEHAELYDHFAKHTAKAINFDEEDFYACQVAIPTMVKDCPALAATVFSVAATCSGVDILSHDAPIPGDRERVMKLLAQANRHHLMSVQTIQRVIAAGGPALHQRYDHVLANAWLMAAYGTASHRLRIWLYRTKPAGQALDHEFLPNQLCWLTMFYFVHAVYRSILDNGDRRQSAHMTNEASSTTNINSVSLGDVVGSVESSTNTPRATALLAGVVPFSEEIIAPAKYPMHISHHALYPMLVSTSPTALQALRRHAEHVAQTIHTTGNSVAPHHQESLASSLSAIEILSDIVIQIRNTTPTSLSNTFGAQTEQGVNNSPGFQFDFTPSEGRGRFAEISPWLRNYLTRALAVTPSRPLRRLIMAFAYRVPRDYLEKVKSLLGSFPLDSGPTEGTSSGANYSSRPRCQPEPKSEEDQISPGNERYHVHVPIIDPAILDPEYVEASETGSSNKGKGTCIDINNPPHHSSTNPRAQQQTPQEMLDALVIDVFAHWLAFTLLLDGVWFFGEIGHWELGRIVAMVRNGGLKMAKVGSYVDNDDNETENENENEEPWWPGRVYDFAEAIRRGEAPKVWW